MTRSSRNSLTTQLLAATNARTFHTFLLMEQFDREAIGQRIARARHERGLTQDDLAALASFSKRALQEYEAGVRIPYKHLAELHRLLKKPTEWFLYGDDDEELGTTERLDQVEAGLSETRVLLERVAAKLGVERPEDGQQANRQKP